VLGPGDKLYFAESNADEIVLLTLNSSGYISQVSSFSGQTTGRLSIALGSDGSTWFVGSPQFLSSSPNGTSWTTVDNTMGWDPTGGFGLRIGPGNRPHLAAMSGIDFHKRVWRWNSSGGTWDMLGGDVEVPLCASTTSADDYSFCITSAGVVFTIGIDYSTPGVKTAYMNGTIWQFVTLDATDITTHSKQIIAFNSNVYAGFTKEDGNDPSVYKWVSPNWNKLPSMANSTTANGGFNIATSPSGELFAAHVEGTNVVIKKYNGTSWVNVHQSGSAAAFTTTNESGIQIIPGTTKCYAVTTDLDNLVIWSLTY
jgi:hypothetical protein